MSLTEVGPYRVLEQIGRGASSTVLRGVAPDGAAVALKVLARRLDPAALERFARERRMLAELGSLEGFVPLLGSGILPDGRAWVAMPLVPGGTLAARLARGPLEIDATVALGRSIARALGVAHARGIVHRDVKPENVLFDADGSPLVADLGLAKHFAGSSDASQNLSATGDFRGTPHYIAPEQGLDSTHVGPPADVYALGCVLYQALTGRLPSEGATLVELLGDKEAERFVPIRSLRPETPAWLAAAVERCLAADPAARPQDGEALARRLERGNRARGSLRALALGTLGALAVAAALALARRPVAPETRVAVGLEADLALLARQGEDGDRRAALARVVTARIPGQLSAAVELSPRSAWLRRARALAASRDRAPLVAEDVLAASPGASREEREALLGGALAAGLRGPSGPEAAAALRAGLPDRPEASHLEGAELLGAGRRDEAVAALTSAARVRGAGILLRAASDVDAFVAERARATLLDGGRLRELAERASQSLAAAAALPTAAEGLGTLVAPVVPRLREIAVVRPITASIRLLPEHVAYEALFGPVVEGLPDTTFALYELATRARRTSSTLATVSGSRWAERLDAAARTWRSRDPDLSVEAQLMRLVVNDALGAAAIPRERIPAILVELEGLAASPHQRGRAAVALATHWSNAAFAGADADLSSRQLLCLAACRRARSSLSDLPHGLTDRTDAARLEGIALMVLERLEEAEEIVTPYAIELAGLLAEVRRRRGNAEGALALLGNARANVRAGMDPRGWLAEATAAVLLSATGRRDEAQRTLDAVAGSGNPQRFLYELPLDAVRQLVAEGRLR